MSEALVKNARGYDVASSIACRGGIEFSVREGNRPIYFLNGYRVGHELYKAVWTALREANGNDK